MWGWLKQNLHRYRELRRRYIHRTVHDLWWQLLHGNEEGLRTGDGNGIYPLKRSYRWLCCKSQRSLYRRREDCYLWRSPYRSRMWESSSICKLLQRFRDPGTYTRQCRWLQELQMQREEDREGGSTPDLRIRKRWRSEGNCRCRQGKRNSRSYHEQQVHRFWHCIRMEEREDRCHGSSTGCEDHVCWRDHKGWQCGSPDQWKSSTV